MDKLRGEKDKKFKKDKKYIIYGEIREKRKIGIVKVGLSC
jgi:hypothetical protein